MNPVCGILYVWVWNFVAFYDYVWAFFSNAVAKVQITLASGHYDPDYIYEEAFTFPNTQNEKKINKMTKVLIGTSFDTNALTIIFGTPRIIPRTFAHP